MAPFQSAYVRAPWVIIIASYDTEDFSSVDTNIPFRNHALIYMEGVVTERNWNPL